MIFYHCPQLRRLAQNEKIRNQRDAARAFAHRLAIKMFGRTGVCLAIEESLRASQTLTSFKADIGTRRSGFRKTIHIPVRTVRA